MTTRPRPRALAARLHPLAVVTLIAMIAALLAAAPPLSTSADAATAGFTQDGAAEPTGTRIAGDDPVGTAIALAEDTYDTAATVVLARLDDYADALTGSTLAATLNSPGPGQPPVGAPILFTESATLSDGVLAAIQGLGAGEVVILGGVSAVSQDVEDTLADEGLTTRRVAGDTRFTTALAVADELVGAGNVPAGVFFVEGEHADDTRGWPDAINVAAVAAAAGQPILPVNAEFVPPVIAERWAAWQAEVDSAFIVGGTAAVSETTAAALAGEGDPLPRLAGSSRFATSVEVYRYGVSEVLLDPSVRYVIPGGSFVEGLAAGAAAGAQGHPTIMVDSTDPAGSPAAVALVGEALDLLDSYVLVGDETAIPAAVADAIAAATTPVAPDAATCLTLLHHNDGESQLLGTGSDELFGSLARMVTLANAEQAAADAADCPAVTVTSGDNFLAGPELSASDPTADEGTVLDAIGLSLVGYDALALGNHDFDFGPDFTARFIESFQGDDLPPFLSANLDVSGVPSLQALAEADRIAPRVTVDAGGTDVGIIGLTTPGLRSISSPGDVVVQQEIAEIVQTQIDELTDEGVDHVILISHLQGLSEDLDLIPQLSGLDAVVAGGGDEVLADAGDPLVPGDTFSVFDAYPLELTDADGHVVPTVTTAGDYKYLGRLTLYFGDDGELLADTPYADATSRMLRVADESVPAGVARDATVVEQVEGPVRDFVEGLAEQVIGTSEVPLDGARPNIRQTETNLGNLVADAHRFIAETRGPEFGIDTSATQVVGLQNGGGIRNNNVIEAGEITELTTFDILPFANFIAAVPDFTAQQLKDVLERAYSNVENADGAFAHVSNLIVEVDLSQPAQEADVDDQGNVTITAPGQRVRTLTIEGDGTELVVDGVVQEGAPAFILASIDFSIRNGDAYPFNLDDDGFTLLGTSYQQALSEYLRANTDGGGLGGVISAEQYPVGGDGRITITGSAG